MTTRAKELANKLRIPGWEGMPTVEEKYDIAAHLDAKDAIDSAAPGEVREIADAHQLSEITEHSADSWAATPQLLYAAAVNEHERCATLLAIVQKQAGEMLEMCQAQDVANERLEAARAEVERLNERLRLMQHGETEALKMMAAEKQRADLLQMRLDASQETLTKVVHERNDLRTKEQEQSERADVLAEGVRLFWGDNGWNAAAALEWKRKHGHLVGDGK